MSGGALTRAQIAALTQARLTHGPRGRALDTASSLRFALDYAQARQAVDSELDVPACIVDLQHLDLRADGAASAAPDRPTYIKRPDMGRRLAQGEAERLSALGPCDVALVLGDGLSAVAAQLNGPAFLGALAGHLSRQGLHVGPVIVARQARVALGDGIARALGARTVVVALGERPGLSAADSLGVYITRNPEPHTPDSARNCISNVREAGLPVAQTAQDAAALIAAMIRLDVSGVALSKARGAGRLLE